ncbi:aspartate--tRNA(Asn) ligase [Actinotalea sp. M2MS4P-6]|uniref:aspartate--tRNA(Asn) ligase n=1 Tax=Actinotalea sp. M2MS4P-6 TaxID=2983762 RepID=UPI0021E3C40D|nr:aspartate--tRNA(Asn) ligase [Actinotalea sp. M2MS4P-6]MCV2395341.1 aspartate--tRNA(Asn) ligase [Actinotalea sp. M2MS4P-6]
MSALDGGPVGSAAPSRTLAAELAAVEPGSTVSLMGHVHRRRELASVTFLVVRDRSGLAQVVLRPGDVPPDGLPPEETAIEVTGVATANPQAPGGIEVTEPRVVLLTEPALTPPVELWRPSLTAGLPALLDHAPVTWRHPAQRATWELAAASLRGFRDVLTARGFTEIHSPKLVEQATESGANVFEVDYFGRPAYLAQSPQFYKQQLVGVFERVYEVGPVFRAEPHDTVRHLAEYVSLDVELGFIRDHRDVVAVLRDVLAGMVEGIRQHAGPAVERLDLTLPRIPDEVPTIHFADALRRVGAPVDEPDLAPEHERALGAWASEELDSDVLVVEGYPMRKRPFYTHGWTGEPVPGGPWSNSFDLLFRGLELATGGQRLHRPSDYEAAIVARGERPSAYAAYLQAFAHGMPPHGGFAIGLERWVARLTGAANIREVTLFPRDLHRLTP